MLLGRLALIINAFNPWSNHGLLLLISRQWNKCNTVVQIKAYRQSFKIYCGQFYAIALSKLRTNERNTPYTTMPIFNLYCVVEFIILGSSRYRHLKNKDRKLLTSFVIQYLLHSPQVIIKDEPDHKLAWFLAFTVFITSYRRNWKVSISCWDVATGYGQSNMKKKNGCKINDLTIYIM